MRHNLQAWYLNLCRKLRWMLTCLRVFSRKRATCAEQLEILFLDSICAIPTANASLAPLPTTLSARIPQELFERIIDHLHDEIPALLACCVVCRAWVPASRYHLFGRLLVRPLVLTLERLQVNCAVSLQGKERVLYGTDNGIYFDWLQPTCPPTPVLLLPDPVTQIDMLDHYGLVVFLSGHRLMTVPLEILDPSTIPRDSSSCTRISSHVTFFEVGTILGRDLVCVVKAGLSTTCKLLHPVTAAHPGSQGFTLGSYKEFYVSERVTSIHFLRTVLVAGTSRHDFEVISVETLQTQPLLDPSVILPETGKSLPKCLAVFRIGRDVLLCYNYFAVYVDSHGLRLNRNSIWWRTDTIPIHAVALREPYLLGFAHDHIEVRHVQSGALIQTIWIDHTVLSLSPELFMIQTQDGRLLGLQFED
ncbi:putative CNH-domain-containing protein [Lyophyllum shimeji]|uniref:CNH-domain-containing protein n=1 Tax=Lyophyllum shimeji TaxID=47721 RepID=A0A9P3PEU8_LYOSH|nr:putative CNH-domain-containing protein [Lyophyllum shimeji]